MNIPRVGTYDTQGWFFMLLNHVMVDIETLGVNEDSVILAIGACRFHPNGGIDYVNPFYRTVSIKEQVEQLGRRIDAATLKWWLIQDQYVRDEVFKEEGSLVGALVDLRKWWKETDCAFPWSNGSNFDIAILSHAYKGIGQVTPWLYYNIRDTRTAWALAEDMGWTRVKRNCHHAIEDAFNQAEDVIKAVAWIKKGAIR